MTEKFLNLPQIHAVLHQMGGKAVAQGVGRCRFGKTKTAPDVAQGFLGDPLMQPSAFFSAKQRVVCPLGKGGAGKITVKGFLDNGQDGDLPLLLPFPENTQETLSRQIGDGEGKGLGDPEPASV